MKSRLRTFGGALAALIVAGGLYYYRDQIPPPQALSSAAGQAQAVVGLIGKATNAQQKLEPDIAALEATGNAWEQDVLPLQDRLDAIGKDLETAFNLINAGAGVTQDQVGWYYARQKTQGELAQRIDALLAQARGE